MSRARGQRPPSAVEQMRAVAAAVAFLGEETSCTACLEGGDFVVRCGTCARRECVRRELAGAFQLLPLKPVAVTRLPPQRREVGT